MPSRPLRFIHITKTGGTAIESAGQAIGQAWGLHDTSLKRFILEDNGKLPAFSHHHHPWTSLSEHRVQELIRSADWFAVVRDPVDRVRSEYFCRFGNHLDDHSPESMNRMVRQFLIQLIRGKANKLPAGPGHWLPQTHFTHPRGQRVVRHILCFHHLEAEWRFLLEAHGLPVISLPHKLPSDIARPEVLPEVDLFNRLLIRWVYRRDYRLLKRHWSRRKPILDDFSILSNPT